MSAHWHIEPTVLSANCSSRLSARVGDLHLLFLSARGSELVDSDPADEITRASMQATLECAEQRIVLVVS